MQSDREPALLGELIDVFVVVGRQIAGGQRVQAGIIEQKVFVGIDETGKLPDLFLRILVQDVWGVDSLFHQRPLQLIVIAVLFSRIAPVFTRLAVEAVQIDSRRGKTPGGIGFVHVFQGGRNQELRQLILRKAGFWGDHPENLFFELRKSLQP